MVLETALGRIEQFDLMALLLRRWQWKSRSHQLPKMNLQIAEEMSLEKMEQFDMMAPWMMAMDEAASLFFLQNFAII